MLYFTPRAFNIKKRKICMAIYIILILIASAMIIYGVATDKIWISLISVVGALIITNLACTCSRIIDRHYPIDHTSVI